MQAVSAGGHSCYPVDDENDFGEMLINCVCLFDEIACAGSALEIWVVQSGKFDTCFLPLDGAVCQVFFFYWAARKLSCIFHPAAVSLSHSFLLRSILANGNMILR